MFSTHILNSGRLAVRNLDQPGRPPAVIGGSTSPPISGVAAAPPQQPPDAPLPLSEPSKASP